MANQKKRNMKVYEQWGCNRKVAPTIILKGKWLKEAGFDSGMPITVICEDGKLIITPREYENYIDEFEAQQDMMVAEVKGGYC